MQSSPTLEGFRAAFRRPSLALAEIAWRWTVGAIAAAVFLFGFIEYLDTLSVNNIDGVLLRSKQPMLVVRAITHILRGSLSRAVLTVLFAAFALLLLWMIAASLGRSATVRALLAGFRRSRDPVASSGTANPSHSFRPLIGLNFLRAAAVLAAILAFSGAAILASFASSRARPQPGLVFIIFMPLAAFISSAWSALNWLLSLACIFAVRDGEDTLGALSAAVTFLRERTGAIVAVSTWNGFAHLVAFVAATTVASLPLTFISIAPGRIVVAGIIFVTLAYFAIVDWLYIARLAGYIFIAEMPDTMPAPATWPAAPPSGLDFALSVSPQTTIDRDELILSDLPILQSSRSLLRLVNGPS